ncbi:MAG: AAA family ATPase [Desulfovibrio sp.]
MYISRVQLTNWRNFRNADARLKPRAYLVGPNASGKSNFLDVFRFIRDIVKDGGGLQYAIASRGKLSKIRCLAARSNPIVTICVELSPFSDEGNTWTYSIAIRQESRGYRRTVLAHEKVWKNEKLILDRPTKEDKRDKELLTETDLENVKSNSAFREVADFFKAISYMHLIPQLLRYPDNFPIAERGEDFFGRSFLERVAQTPEKQRKSRLKFIEQALRTAVPQLQSLKKVTDDMGHPHLEVVYEHWRSQGAKQREDQFSDGTLRLIALMWSLLDGDSLLLLEEPELSLNAAIVRQLSPLIYKAQKRKKRRQVIISTHDYNLLSDPGIGAEEVLILQPEHEGTSIQSAFDNTLFRSLMENGLSAADAGVSETNLPGKLSGVL